LDDGGQIEFSRVPLFEASSANIVKEAGIPRGSFYQYFDDKVDLYFYILKQYAAEKRIQLIALLEKHDGNIFEAISDLYIAILNRIEEDRSEEHTSELQSRFDLVCRLLLEKKNNKQVNDRFANIT